LQLPARVIQRILRREKGQTIVEYALILVLFSVALITAQQFFQGGLESYYKYIADALSSVI
jgi:Flp pilus assembly pilin Flp